ncbi:M56 family metallopeptidase [Actinoplanes sp. NPDC049265]|uniref:M56 family metallopeptidase n=1 Tax=Actinoplanes sp. NPDC049265 TaxID=3363902 RepID=UPI0037154A68
MTLTVYLPLLMALPLTFAAHWIAARAVPGPVVWTLTITATVAAACSTWSLGLLTLTMLDDVPPLKTLDDHPTLELPEPVPGPVALVAGLLLLGAGLRLLLDVRRRTTTNRRLREVGTVQDGLVIADWSAPLAVAVPGRPRRPGHLLLTTGILRALDAQERRVVVAHEQAHLRHRHHRLTAAAGAAAALNPLLIPVRNTVTFLVERWADEDAAAEVGDRDLAAAAVARAALATGAGPPTALGIDGGALVQRVRALAAPAPAARLRRLAGPILLSAAFLAVAVLVTVQFVALATAWLSA